MIGSKNVSLNGLKLAIASIKKLLSAKAENPDWQENDKTSLGYIKGRFGGYDEQKTLIEEGTYYFDNPANVMAGQTFSAAAPTGYMCLFAGVPYPGNGVRVTLTIDGKDYVRTPPTDGFPEIGNYNLQDPNGDPFYLTWDASVPFMILPTGGDHVIKLTYIYPKVIDKKYIPDAKKANGTEYGTVCPAIKQSTDTKPVHVDVDNGSLWTTPDVSPVNYVNDMTLQVGKDSNGRLFARPNVNPSTRTSDMTQAVGVSSNGRLWTLPRPNIVVDSAMSNTSYNAVQNRVIKEYVDDKTTIDTEMSDTSTKTVQNKVIKKYVDGKVVNVDTNMSNSSTNPVQNKIAKDYVDRNINGIVKIDVIKKTYKNKTDTSGLDSITVGDEVLYKISDDVVNTSEVVSCMSAVKFDLATSYGGDLIVGTGCYGCNTYINSSVGVLIGFAGIVVTEQGECSIKSKYSDAAYTFTAPSTGVYVVVQCIEFAINDNASVTFPKWSPEDNGKVLGVADGKLAWLDPNATA